MFTNFLNYLDDPQGSNANCGDYAVISGLRWYTSDQYGLLIMVGGVGGHFSQTAFIKIKFYFKALEMSCFLCYEVGACILSM